MVYLERFALPTQGQEDAFLGEIKRTCYDSRYPFNVFRYRRMPELEFAPHYDPLRRQRQRQEHPFERDGGKALHSPRDCL